MPKEEVKISPAVVIIPLGLGLGLAGMIAFVTLARAMGFTLGITNAPAGAVLWNANFDWQSFDYDPIADSGWLSIDESWDYPSDPRGCTTLHIWALDAENNVIFDIYNLGPVDDGKSYIFDYASGMLIEVEVE
ncbi:hypothetical protein ES703_36202 [subsurface metagenome]